MELYIHLPFCKSKCRYCDFASWSGREALIDDYIDALIAEAADHSRMLGSVPVSTVFIGGGTPSVVPPEAMLRLFKGIRSLFDIMPDAEFTTEANPGTISEDWLSAAVQGGVNRVSLGMQAYQPSLLKMLGRIHTYSQVESSVHLLHEAGITNFNLDLMFGLPGQTEEMWQETLSSALSLGPTHLSCYGLIPEEGTPLHQDLRMNRLSLPDEDAERRMYDTAIRTLVYHGFEQYEISNFAKPGYACRHNLGYWDQTPYLGIGASASSMLASFSGDTAYCRITNPREISVYLDMVHENNWNMRETEEISRQEARFETMMLGLRTTKGVSESAFMQMHGVSLSEVYGNRLASISARGLIHKSEDGRWALTRRGMDIQNSILVELMED